MGAKRAKREVETADFIRAASRFLRAAGRRVADADEIELGMLVSLRRDLEAAEAEAVKGLRDRGASWSYIALGLGITRQAAQQRWGERMSA